MSLDVNISEPEEFNDVELHNCLKEVTKARGIDDFEYHVEFISGQGDHYIANVFRVLIKDTATELNINVIVKTLVNTTRQNLFHELHKREVMVYREVIPLFETVQQNYHNDKIELPKCLYSNTERGKEILIFDDLLAKGFATDSKVLCYENLDYLQVRLVITELAKFHALSFICERKESDMFNKLKVQFQDIIFEENFLNKSKLRSYFPESFQLSLKLVIDEDAKKKLQQVEGKLLPVLRKYVQPRRFNVLCHGDCWINNMLFKHEVMKQSRVCFLDFQTMRYASPVIDIIHFLYICTDSAFRSEHFDTLQNVYYDSLKSALKISDIDIVEVYPREDYENDIKDYLPFGLLIALLQLRLVKTNIDDGDLNKDNNNSVFDIPEDVIKPILFEVAVNDVVIESVKNNALDRLLEDVKSL